jgi:hypothetical protein
MGRRRGTRIDSIAALDMETMRPMFGFGAQHFGPIARAMGVRFPSAFSNTFIGPLPANATETVVCTTPPLTLPLDGATVILLWLFSYTAGTGNTTTGMLLRRGTTIAGALVNAATNSGQAVPTGPDILSGCYFDTPGAVAGQQYSLTIQQFGASAAGTFRDVALLAFAL